MGVRVERDNYKNNSIQNILLSVKIFNAKLSKRLANGSRIKASKSHSCEKTFSGLSETNSLKNKK